MSEVAAVVSKTGLETLARIYFFLAAERRVSAYSLTVKRIKVNLERSNDSCERRVADAKDVLRYQYLHPGITELESALVDSYTRYRVILNSNEFFLDCRLQPSA